MAASSELRGRLGVMVGSGFAIKGANHDYCVQTNN